MSGLIQNLISGAMPQQEDGSSFNLDVASPFKQNLGSIEDLLAQRGLAQDEQANPFTFKTETGKDGRLETTVKGPHEEILKIQEKMKLLDQVLGSFHDRSQYLQAQEQAGRNRSPILQALSSVAGNLAAGDKRLPPIVQALGKANLEMNPSQQVLGQRAQDASMAEAAVAKEQAGLAKESLALQLEEGRDLRHMDAQARAEGTRMFHEIGLAAQKGELTDAKATEQLLLKAGVPKDKAGEQAKALVDISNRKQANDALKESARDERQRKSIEDADKRAQNRDAILLQSLAMKATEKEADNKGIEAAAQSLAKGELSSIKDISSFRGAQRLQIFARARELNPKFNTGEIDRKIKMEQAFTTGKDGQALQSYGTFLEHAGEATDALQGTFMTSSPVLNTPINKVKREVLGSPDYQRFMVSLEPVRKEFEGFLLGGRALYADDRKQAEIILSNDSSPAQIKAALKQMGKTAKDRYTEMNQRYKRVMKQDIQDAFSDEALAGAAKIGVSIPPNRSMDTSLQDSAVDKLLGGASKSAPKDPMGIR